MSSTNKTTHYELPQYVDNDIFNPLVDDNDAYEKIDTALHNIANAEADDASEIVNVKSRMTSAEGDIDDIKAQNGNSVLTTTAQTLSGAINEVNSEADALAGRMDVVEDDINNVSTGLKAKVTSLENQNGNEQLTTKSNTISGGLNEVNNNTKILFTTKISEYYNASKALIDIGIVHDDLYTMQGGAVNTNNGNILIAFVKENVEVCILKLLNSNWEVILTANASLGHANDITYNPVTDKYYVASGDNSANIYVLNSSTLAIEDTINLGENMNISQIAYYPTDDMFYFTTGGSAVNMKIYKCDNDFTNITFIANVPVVTEYEELTSLKVQGACFINNCYVPLLWAYGAENAEASFSRLWFLDIVKGEFVYHKDICSQSRGDEAEFIYGHDGYYSIIGYSERYITKCDVYIDGNIANNMLCITKKFCPSVNAFPVNAFGIATLRDTASPTGAEITGSFISYGNFNTRTIQFSYNNKNYINFKVDGVWSGWIDITDGIMDEAKTRASLTAHNLLKLNIDELKAINTSGVWDGNSYTFRNVTFTVNDDMTITVSGTASDPYPYFYLKQYSVGNKCPFIGKTVILNGCPDGGSNSTYRLRFTKMDGTNEYSDYGDGTQAVTVADGTSGSGAQQIYMSIYNCSNTPIFKPQVRLSTDAVKDYEEFAETNYNLTHNKLDISCVAPLEQIVAINNHTQGDYFMLNGKFCKASTSITTGDTLVLNTNYTVTTISAELLN